MNCPPFDPPIVTIPTTLAAPCAADDEMVLIASSTGVTNPGLNNTTPCYFLVDGNEYMQVQDTYVEGTLLVPVVRGFNGTLGIPHLTGAPVLISAEINSGPFAQ